MINNQVTEQTSAIKSARPKAITQSDDIAGSSDQVAVLRTKAEQLEQGIAGTEIKLSSKESESFGVPDKKLEKEIANIRKDLADKLTVFDSLRAQIEQLKPTVGGDKLVAEVLDYQDFAEKNKEAYSNVIKLFLQETKEMIGENPERQDLLKMGFLNQAKVGKEGVEFWGQQAEFWGDQAEQGSAPEKIKEELVGLYDQVLALENKITNLFGSAKKDEQGSAKSELDEVKNKISALRGAS